MIDGESHAIDPNTMTPSHRGLEHEDMANRLNTSPEPPTMQSDDDDLPVIPISPDSPFAARVGDTHDDDDSDVPIDSDDDEVKPHPAVELMLRSYPIDEVITYQGLKTQSTYYTTMYSHIHGSTSDGNTMVTQLWSIIKHISKCINTPLTYRTLYDVLRRYRWVRGGVQASPSEIWVPACQYNFAT